MSEARTTEYDLTALLSGDYYCAGCAERVCGAVAELPGVGDAKCDLETGTLSVSHDLKSAAARDLDSQIRRIALEASDSVGHAAYRLTGLD